METELEQYSIIPTSIFSQNVKDMVDKVRNLPETKHLDSLLTGRGQKTKLHLGGVALLMGAIVTESDLCKIIPENDIEISILAALAHDAGQANISGSEDDYRRRYTEKDWIVMEDHPTNGWFMNKCLFPTSRLIADVALMHHIYQDRNYPNIQKVEAYICTESKDYRHKLDIIAPFVALADQCEARAPLAGLNTHPYNYRTNYSVADVIGSAREELLRSPNLNMPLSLFEQGFEIMEDKLNKTISYYSDRGCLPSQWESPNKQPLS